MLQITSSQLSYLGELSFERYLDRLTEILRSESFVNDLARHITDLESEQAVRTFIRKLVARAAALGIECEGDVTPFCLLAICNDTEFRQSGIYSWVTTLVQATNFSAEERMDAIYSLLPESVRTKVFFQYRDAE